MAPGGSVILESSEKWCPRCEEQFDEPGLFYCPSDGSLLQDFAFRDDDLIGRIVAGRFRIERLIGSGGMGSVYKARQLSVDRVVALKVLKGEVAADKLSVRRFMLEAKATSRLSSAHTITIYDFGESDEGVLFIAMEYLEGQDLRARLETGGPMAVADALDIIGQVCTSLAEAHEQGIIHRDLKPENIFLTTRPNGDRHVKVLDFGIARATSLTEGMTMTKTGMVAGTPAYMAPEGVLGDPVDVRADVYALGAIMYEMIAGEPAFSGPSPFALMQAHVTEMPPRLAERVPERVVPELSELVVSCLAKSPDNRPRSAGALMARLGRLRQDPAVDLRDRVDLESAFADTECAMETLPKPLSSPSQKSAPSLPASTDLRTGAEFSTLPATRQSSSVPPARGGVRYAAAAAAFAAAAVVAGLVASGVFEAEPVGEPSAMQAAIVGQDHDEAAASAAELGEAKVEEATIGLKEDTVAEVTLEAAPVEVALTVITDPAAATVMLGTEVLGTTPCVVRLVQGDEVVALELSRSGFEPQTLDVTPNKDGILQAHLDKVVPAPKKRPATGRRTAHASSKKKNTAKSKIGRRAGPAAAAPAKKAAAPAKKAAAPANKAAAPAKKAASKPVAAAAGPKPAKKKSGDDLFFD